MDLSAFTTTPVLMAVISAGSILILFWGLSSALSQRNATIETRLDRYTVRHIPVDAQRTSPRNARFSSLVGEKRGSAIATELARADLRLTPGEYVVLNVVSVVVGALLL